MIRFSAKNLNKGHLRKTLYCTEKGGVIASGRRSPRRALIRVRRQWNKRPWNFDVQVRIEKREIEWLRHMIGCLFASVIPHYQPSNWRSEEKFDQHLEKSYSEFFRPSSDASQSEGFCFEKSLALGWKSDSARPSMQCWRFLYFQIISSFTYLSSSRCIYFLWEICSLNRREDTLQVLVRAVWW